MKKLEKLSNQTFQTLEKSQMNHIVGGADYKSGDQQTTCNPSDTISFNEDHKGNVIGTKWVWN